MGRMGVGVSVSDPDYVLDAEWDWNQYRGLGNFTRFVVCIIKKYVVCDIV